MVDKLWVPGMEHGLGKHAELKRQVSHLLNEIDAAELVPNETHVDLFKQIRDLATQLYPGIDEIPAELKADIEHIKNILETSETTKAAMAVLATRRP